MVATTLFLIGVCNENDVCYLKALKSKKLNQAQLQRNEKIWFEGDFKYFGLENFRNVRCVLEKMESLSNYGDLEHLCTKNS